MLFHPFELNLFKEVESVEEGFVLFDEKNITNEYQKFIPILSIQLNELQVRIGDVLYDIKNKSFFIFTLVKNKENQLGLEGFKMLCINTARESKKLISMNSFKENYPDIKNLKYYGNVFLHKDLIKNINRFKQITEEDNEGFIVFDKKTKDYLYNNNFKLSIMLNNKKSESVILRDFYYDNEEDFLSLLEKIKLYDFNIYLVRVSQPIIVFSNEEIVKLKEKQSNLINLRYSHQGYSTYYTGELNILNEEFNTLFFNNLLKDKYLDYFYTVDYEESEVKEIINSYKSFFITLSENGEILLKSSNKKLPLDIESSHLIYFNEYIYNSINFDLNNDIYTNEYLKTI